MAAAVTYTFTAGTAARAAEVNQNFTDLVNYINTNVILKDGSVAFTGIPTLPNADPTNSNHAARKAYVDTQATRIDLLDIELDTKASRQVFYDSLEGGTDTLLVASGPYNTWNGTPLTGSVSEVINHRYFFMCHFPQLMTNQNGITFSFWIPPTRLAARVKRNGIELGRGYTSHLIANKGDGSVTIVGTVLAGSTASQTWEVEVLHLHDENNGGAAAQIRYSGTNTWPVHLTVVDLGLHF